MISRIAEQSFWMCRYLERLETFARSFLATHLFSLDSHEVAFEEFFRLSPLEKPLYIKIYNSHDTDEELIQYFRVWQELNPESLLSLLGNARANGLLIREIISESMWQMINRLYLWMHSETVKKLYMTDKYNFYTRIIETTQLIKGMYYNLLLRDEYYHIMSVGLMTERLTQVVLMLDKLNSKEFFAVSANSQSENNLLKCLLESFASTQNYLRSGYGMSSTLFAKFFTHDLHAPHALNFILRDLSMHLSILQTELHGFEQPHLHLKDLAELFSQLNPSIFLCDKGLETKQQIFSVIYKMNEELRNSIFATEKILV
ncbi:MAG: alpha-E domain-containing protein [Parachlamydiaceae bacterium]|nr:alpha-E domain-containing protein [Parachlamydiaceae bacterium]